MPIRLASGPTIASSEIGHIPYTADEGRGSRARQGQVSLVNDREPVMPLLDHFNPPLNPNTPVAEFPRSLGRSHGPPAQPGCFAPGVLRCPAGGS